MYEWLEQELIGIEPALSEAKAKNRQMPVMVV